MAGKVRFGSSFFGFKRSDVNIYIENLVRDFESKIRQKETEIEILRSKINEIEGKQNADGQDRAAIAEVLIQARTDAERLLEDAKSQAEAQKQIIEEKIEHQRQYLVQLKEKIREFRIGLLALMNDFDGKLTRKVEEMADGNEEIQGDR
ncbi:MAG TPA: hypothetical protein DD727_05610 [Clostridiales bacterium]|nr:hypothetical protein [Clostridiales bacterium]